MSEPGALLYGIKALAAFLGITERQAYHLAAKGALPTWKEGRTVVASRASISAWIASREASR